MSEVTHQILASSVVVGSGKSESAKSALIQYSFATLVNDRSQYDEMLHSFSRGGFGRNDCEFLFVDNTGDIQTDAFSGLNAALLQARGRYVVLCHQDVRLLVDGRDVLDERIRELESLDKAWAVAGNAGGVCAGKLAIRISDPHGADQSIGDFPSRVESVDENFIVVKRSSGVSFSNDLSGFHLYGADLCLNSEVRGCRSYVIDFHLQHLSAGNKDLSFARAEQEFCDKWDLVLRPRLVQTTCTLLWVGGSRFWRPVRRAGAIILARAMRFSARVRSTKQLDFIGFLKPENRRLLDGLGRRDG